MTKESGGQTRKFERGEKMLLKTNTSRRTIDRVASFPFSLFEKQLSKPKRWKMNEYLTIIVILIVIAEIFHMSEQIGNNILKK